MSNQNQATYPPPATAYPAEPQMAPPAPAGYPVKDGPQQGEAAPPTTQSRGDGFWKGWLVVFFRILIFNWYILFREKPNPTCI
ncbi:hypothetical protein ACS0TY_030145 [Phlomoides rotata]